MKSENRVIGPYDKAIANHVHMHSVGDPDLVRRRWYSAVMHNLHCWEERRVYEPSKTPFEAALECVEQTGGSYCEGLVLLPGLDRPQPAIWCRTLDELVCFTHDLTLGEHGIQGFPVADSALQHLFYVCGIRGGYLFHSNIQVADIAIPHFLRGRQGGSRPLLQ